ncbi:hypothetical protein ACLB2K_064973 [Fragaria x ananassa]
MTTFCEMLEEMVVRILSRLPPKSLVRFRGYRSLTVLKESIVLLTYEVDDEVPKSFKILMMDESTGVKGSWIKYLTFGPVEGIIIPLVCWNSEELLMVSNESRVVSYNIVIHSLLTLRNENNGDEDNLYYEIEDLHFPPAVGLKTRGQFIENPCPNYDCAGIVGHCGGIICLTLYHPSDLFLYNPAIKEFKVIPEPCLPGIRELLYRSEAFGYYPHSEDFFIVVVAGYGHYNDGGIEERLTLYPQRAEMYTMRTDSWEEINIHNLENETTMFRPCNFQVYLKGKCYYLALEISKEFMSSFDSLEEMGRAAIVWFDTSYRVFHTALTPDPLYRYPAHDFELAVWNNSVAVFGYHREGSQPFEIWVMGKFDGFTCEWIKRLSIDIMESPLSLVLWEGNQRVRVALYSFATKTSQYFPIYASDYFYAIPVVNSIVPLNRDLICADIS